MGHVVLAAALVGGGGEACLGGHSLSAPGQVAYALTVGDTKVAAFVQDGRLGVRSILEDENSDVE